MIKYCLLTGIVGGLMMGCTVTTERYLAPYNTGYISSVAVYGQTPYWGDNYVYGINSNWYAGTPDYFSPSVYNMDW